MGTITWFFHLVSDMAGSSSTVGITGGTGIPGPILALAKEVSAIPFFKNLKVDDDMSLSVFLSKLFNGTLMMQRDENGQIIKEFPPEVVKQSICKEKTLREITTILEHVVSQGLGKKAGSPSFKVAGKTGTAQISKGLAGYKSGTMNYLLSFVGFFPADAPRYSCIVCIQRPGLPASSGFSALVFHNIAEGIMAQSLKLDVADARDSLSVLVPDVKNGDLAAADYVLKCLGVNARKNWNWQQAAGRPVWGTAANSRTGVTLTSTAAQAKNTVPDVTGMGARDAVYALESRGVRVRLQGRGKVKTQSLPPGHKIRKGETCSLGLEL